MPTLKDVARHCGVDSSTVSRALNDDPRVKVATRERIRAAAAALGYRPHLAARALAAGRTGRLWFCCPALAAPHQHEVAQHASRIARDRGFDLLVSVYGNDPATCRQQVERLDQGLADGAILIPAFSTEVVPGLRRLATTGYPLVLLERSLPDLGIPSVTSDNSTASQELARRLIGDGAQAIVTLMAPGNPVLAARLAGIQQACRQAGIPCLSASDPLPRAEQVGLCGTDQATVVDWQATHRLPRLSAAVFDRWVGGIGDLHRVHICRQDFPGLASAALDVVLAQLDGARPASRRLPALHFDQLDR